MDKQDCNVPGCKDHFIGGPTTTHFCGRGVMERMSEVIGEMPDGWRRWRRFRRIYWLFRNDGEHSPPVAAWKTLCMCSRQGWAWSMHQWGE